MGKMVFSLGDNLVTVLSCEKGRSSSMLLNNLCRRACGYVFGCRFIWRIRHVRTQYNVADGPSRASTPSTPLVSPVSLQPGHKQCLELFAGAGGLSAALQRKGLRTFIMTFHESPHSNSLYNWSLCHLFGFWSRARHAIKNVARARGRELLGVQLFLQC